MARILFALRAKKGVARRESRNRTRSWQSADTRLLQANFTRSVSISTAAAAPIRLAIRISNAPTMPLPAFSIHCAWHCQCSLPPPPMGGSFTQVLADPEGLEALMRIATWSKDPGRGRYREFLSKSLIALTAAAAAMSGAPARAQLPMPASTQFDITGFIQEATLDPACAANPHCGGTIKVNGHVIVVPKETVVEFPANALTWQEIFSQAPALYGLSASPQPETGMAIADLPATLTTYEAHVIGNRVLNGPAGADLHIAGLIFVAQASLSSGSGFINFIDYSTGELRIGGTLGSNLDGTRVRLNDPTGRYGRVTSPDIRFTVDPDNPTVIAASGYPMCIPRTDPAVSDDPLCPQAQRPVVSPGPPVVYQTLFTMNDPTHPRVANLPPSAFTQAPMEIGDWVTFGGLLVTDAATPTTGPFPANGTAGTYVAAHTIVSNVGIYTAPGTNPAYIMTEVTLIGTGGLTVLGAGEAVIRTRFEGM